MRKSYESILKSRNREIRKHFYLLLTQGCKTMQAYSETADYYNLSEVSIRRIVANKDPAPPPK